MDAFASLYRRWTAVRDPAEADRYLRSCVLNGARSQLRRRRLRRRHESGRPQQDAGRVGLESNEADRSTVTQLLRTLPYRQRQVLVLRYFVDLTEAQIASSSGSAPARSRPTPRAASPLWHENWKVCNDRPRRRRRPRAPFSSPGGDQGHARRRSTCGCTPSAPACRHTQAPASHPGRRRFNRRCCGSHRGSHRRPGLAWRQQRPRSETGPAPRQLREGSSMRSAATTPTTAISYLATGAIVQGDAIARGSDAPEQLRPTLRLLSGIRLQADDQGLRPTGQLEVRRS